MKKVMEVVVAVAEVFVNGKQVAILAKALYSSLLFVSSSRLI